MAIVRFRCDGTPRPQGSLTSWRTGAGTRARIAHAGGIPFLRWRARVTTAAILAMSDHPPYPGPVQLVLEFHLPRPPGPRGKAARPTGHPDLDKLSRAVLDSLSGVCYPDDAQVVRLSASKVWATELHPEGVSVEIGEALLGSPYPEDGDPYPGS